MPEFAANKLKYHEPTEVLVQHLLKKANSQDELFARTVTYFYLAVAASVVNTKVCMPGNHKFPVNMFAVCLSPSGSGKGIMTSEMEDTILKDLKNNYTNTFRAFAEDVIEARSNAMQKEGTPQDEALAKARKEVTSLGIPPLFTDEATPTGIRQAQMACAMTGYGSINVTIDEVFSVNGADGQFLQRLIIAYDQGNMKDKLIKNTKDNERVNTQSKPVPVNLLLFGTGAHLQNPDTHSSFMHTLTAGLGRRAHIVYNAEANRPSTTPEERVKALYDTGDPATLESMTKHVKSMTNPQNIGKTIYIEDDLMKYIFEYDALCAQRAAHMPSEYRKTEMQHRLMRIVKGAAVLAAYDGVGTMEREHVDSIIKLLEEATPHVQHVDTSTQPHELIATYLAKLSHPVTMAQLMSALPWFKGSEAVRKETIELATEWGLSNNIILRQHKKPNGIVVYSAEEITETNMDNLHLAISNHHTYGYKNIRGSLKAIGKRIVTQGLHWITHHLSEESRSEKACIPGFNFIVLDIDNDSTGPYVPRKVAEELLGQYMFISYETKSSKPNHERYRIVLVTSHFMKLDAEAYAEMMKKIYDFIPFQVDRATNQRSRKWLGHDSNIKLNKGTELFNILEFIPDSEAAANLEHERKTLKASTRLEHWFLRQIIKGAPRNNTLFRYAAVLNDSNMSVADIEATVRELNSKLPSPLSDKELVSTIFKSIKSKGANKSAV